MKHARFDYDCIQPWPTHRPHTARVNGVVHADVNIANVTVDPIIPDDEPVFLVRGQDQAAVPTLEAWCKAAEALGADSNIVNAVKRHIQTIRRWQKEHISKIPDAPVNVLNI